MPRIEVASFNPRNVPHIFRMHWTWEVPVGRGRRFGRNMHPFLDAFVGNWQYSGNSRLESVRYDVLGVKLEGMTVDELQKEFKIGP